MNSVGRCSKRYLRTQPSTETMRGLALDTTGLFENGFGAVRVPRRTSLLQRAKHSPGRDQPVHGNRGSTVARIDNIKWDSPSHIPQIHQQLIDVWIVHRLIGLKRLYTVSFDNRQGRQFVQGNCLVRTAAQSPVGREINQHRMSVRKMLIQYGGTVGFPRQFGRSECDYRHQ